VARPDPARDLSLAVSLLTAWPTHAHWPEDGHTDVAGYLAWPGWLLGGLAAGGLAAAFALGWDGTPAALAAVVVLALWALATRLLHWDGLADTADGIWGGSTPERRLEIMADSRTGAFGVAAVLLVGLTEYAALASLIGASGDTRPVALAALLVGPAVARESASFAAWFGVPARAGGLGAAIMAPPRMASLLPGVLSELLALGVMWVAAGWWGVGWVLVCELVAAAVPHVLSRPVGGVTGDIMGASVLITEAVALASAAFLWGV